MILSTTHNLEGYTITEYLGIVSASNQALIAQNRPQNALKALAVEGAKLEADAIIGIHIVDVGHIAQAYGTAVKLG